MTIKRKLVARHPPTTTPGAVDDVVCGFDVSHHSGMALVDIRCRVLLLQYNFTHDLPDKSAKATGACLLIMIATYGPMQAVWDDGGPEFDGAFADVCEQYGVKREVMPPYHARGNGQVKQFNCTI